MTYEDFLAAWKKLNQASNPENQPRFTIESIKFSGQTHGQRAELKFEAVVHLLTDGPIDVPLGLVGAILQGEPRFGKAEQVKQKAAQDSQPAKANSGDEYLNFDPRQGGFVARLAGHSGDRQLVSFDLIVPLSLDGAETTLALNCPPSASSSLGLKVDSPVSEVRCSSGAVLTNKPAADADAHIEVAGPAGQFRLTWQAAHSNAAAVASVLDAVGAVQVTIDGRGVRSDARLTIRSFGGTFDQFRVRLPRGAKLIRDPAVAEKQEPNYRISEEAASSAPAQAVDKNAQIVLVELKEKSQGPVVVDLSTEQAGHDPAQPLELAGFEVLGAVRQFGDIALNVANDWQARWDIRHEVRQVDPTELDASLQRSELTAAFQYDAQPWSLGVRIAPRQSRVHVTPRYELELLPEEARLNVRLAYQVFGARSFEFRVELNGWEMSGETVESGGLVNQDRVTVTPEGTLILPLAQGSSRKAEVLFALRRSLNRDTSKLQVALPVPLADSVGTGEFTVRVPAEIEFVPDLAKSIGLAASAAPGTSGGAGPDAATELHFRSLLPNAILVANRANRKREASAQIAAHVDIAPDSVQVDQRLEYAVRYEAIKELVFEAGSDIPIDGEGVDIALLSKAGSSSDVAEQRNSLHFEPTSDENEAAASGLRRLRVVLPQPQLGKFSIGIRYRLPRPQKLSAEGALQVPMFSVVDVPVTSERATVRAAQGLSAMLNNKADASSWKMFDAPPKGNSISGGQEFAADRAESVLPLVVGTTESKAPSMTIVERVWLQTWLSSEIEQDRAVFRFRTTGSQTTVELPPNAPPGEIEVVVDGRVGQVLSSAAGRIIVRLAPEANNSSGEKLEPTTHTLELRFKYPIQQSVITRHRLTPPQIDGTTELSQIYWQVVLPGDEHVIQSPVQLTSASQWQWLGSFWGRSPVMSQAELQAWVGASPQLAPAGSDNQYLFTGLLPVSSIAIVTAPRWLIVLLASSAAMLLLAGWFYSPVAGKRWLMALMIFIIAATAIAYPTAALLIAQASAIGVVLGPLSMLLSRFVARPRRRPAPSAITGSSQRMITPRVESMIMPPVVVGASTAPTVTLRSSNSEQ